MAWKQLLVLALACAELRFYAGGSQGDERSARAMDKIVMRDHAKAYATLVARGIEEVEKLASK